MLHSSFWIHDPFVTLFQNAIRHPSFFPLRAQTQLRRRHCLCFPTLPTIPHCARPQSGGLAPQQGLHLLLSHLPIWATVYNRSYSLPSQCRCPYNRQRLSLPSFSPPFIVSSHPGSFMINQNSWIRYFDPNDMQWGKKARCCIVRQRSCGRVWPEGEEWIREALVEYHWL